MVIEMDDSFNSGAKLKVIGVGGCGGNAGNTMIESGRPGGGVMTGETAAPAPSRSRAVLKIQLGANLTKGLGAGSNPDMGRSAAIESKELISEALDGADMVFITAGMGGGRGTGAVPGLVNVAFADVRTIMSEMGQALMGSGTARGEQRAQDAARKAISSPLLEDISISGARGVLINITGSSDMTIHDINEASSLIHEEAHEDAHIIFGAVVDETMGEEVRVTVIATGFGEASEAQKPREAIAPAHVLENLDVPTAIRKERDRAPDLRTGEIRRLSKMGGHTP